MMSEEKNIPKDWNWMKLEEIGILSNSSINPAKYPDEIFELWSVPNFDYNKPELLKGKEIGSNKCIVKENDILLCKINPRINRVWKVGKKTNFKQISSTEWIVIRNELVNPDFVVYQLRSSRIRSDLLKDVSGVGGSLMRARPNAVKELKIALPPLPEQQAIVAKIEELLSDLENGKQQLQTAQQQLKIYRQSLLKAAFEGKLTNQNVKAGELPKGWNLVKLKEVASDISDGDHQAPPKSEKGIPFITISNVNKLTNKIDFSDTFKVNIDYYKNLKANRKPQKGDVLYTVTGSFGISILIDYEKEFCFQRHIGLVRPLNTISQKWVYYLLQSPQILNQAKETATGTAQKTVALSSLRNFNIPFCSFEEQQLIVSELESKLTVCDKIEETISQSLQQAETLRQSILKKAFEGKLVQTKVSTSKKKELA
jgi:type I restriction enzyme, S subunit